METHPENYPVHQSIETVISAAIAAIIIVGLLWGLAELSQSREERAAPVPAAERACAHLSDAQERETCVNLWWQSVRATKD